jgi:hypothetical protein
MSMEKRTFTKEEKLHLRMVFIQQPFIVGRRNLKQWGKLVFVMG